MFISEMLKSLDKRKTPKLRDFSRKILASPAGFEPTTFRLGGEKRQFFNNPQVMGLLPKKPRTLGFFAFHSFLNILFLHIRF